MAKNNKKNDNKQAQAQVSKKGKVNWGVLRDDAHKAIMDAIAEWKGIRNQMAIDQADRKVELEALRNDDRYKGHLIDGEWIVNKASSTGKKHDENAFDYQAEYNEKEEAIAIKYRELAKERRAAIAELHKAVGLDKHLFESYSKYIEVDSGEEERTAYLKEMEAFLKLGLKVPFGEQGLKYAAYELVKGIGKRFNGVGAAYRKDRDAEAFKKQAFMDAVMANLRSILQDKGIIAICPIEDESKTGNGNKKGNQKSKSEPETVSEIAALADLTDANNEIARQVMEAIKIARPEVKAEAKIKNRNRGVANKPASKKGSGKSNKKSESKKEKEIAVA